MYYMTIMSQNIGVIDLFNFKSLLGKLYGGPESLTVLHKITQLARVRAGIQCRQAGSSEPSLKSLLSSYALQKVLGSHMSIQNTLAVLIHKIYNLQSLIHSVGSHIHCFYIMFREKISYMIVLVRERNRRVYRDLQAAYD